MSAGLRLRLSLPPVSLALWVSTSRDPGSARSWSCSVRSQSCPCRSLWQYNTERLLGSRTCWHCTYHVKPAAVSANIWTSVMEDWLPGTCHVFWMLKHCETASKISIAFLEGITHQWMGQLTSQHHVAPEWTNSWITEKKEGPKQCFRETILEKSDEDPIFALSSVFSPVDFYGPFP